MEPHHNKRHPLCVLIAIFILFNTNNQHSYAQRASGRKLRERAASRVNPPTGVEDTLSTKLINEGLDYAEGGKWEEAIKAYIQAISINPRSAEAFIGMGDAYMSIGKYKEGFAAYRNAIKVAPHSADAHYSLGAAYNDMAQYGEAFKPFVEAIRLDPNFAEAYYGIGFAYLWLDNYKDALGYLKSAIRIKPDYPEAHLSLGLTYLGLNNIKAVEDEIKTLKALDASLAKELESSLRSGGKPRATTAAVAAQPSRSERVLPDAQQRLGATEATARNQPSASPQTPASKTARPTSASDESAQTMRAAQSLDAASLLAVELSYWDSVKNSNDPAEFAAYLKKYPDGQFSELAKIRLRALEGKQDATAAIVEQREEATREQPKPAQEMTTPVEETPKPSPEQPKASQEPMKPAQEPAKPFQEQPQPDGEATAPLKESSELNPSATLDETIDWIRKNFSTKFAYKYTTSGEGTDSPTITADATVEYEPLKFEGCRIDWRDQSDVISVSLAELDPDSVKVELRSKPGTNFSIEVWNLSINATGGKGAIREAKGDGSEAVNVYSGLDLQYESRERAERLARALQSAIKLCGGKSQ